MRLRVLAVAATVPLLVACGGTDTPPATGRGPGMLANLPSCDRVPLDTEPEVDARVTGLVLPDDARVTSVVEQGALTTVEATIRMTPLDVRAHYEGRADIELLRVEDEVFETEVLTRAQQRRMYLRAAALCADGTTLTAVVGPDSEEAGLPEFQSG
ncbi:hypothetical protein GA0070609_3025 [Micromonospora echinaurantiaca]|uniref:Lipoprotein n=1 Tax=Micromonospora echinaurantiaca TaxID=47857 RepID=A0A1C5IAY1_9ACTN|nr:hypothetical protein [Micromonospora echinaurantiaca]SCG55259.1 hypothetical protein GA0070609_3025 [Micromonospora echinaurantiaca]